MKNVRRIIEVCIAFWTHFSTGLLNKYVVGSYSWKLSVGKISFKTKKENYSSLWKGQERWKGDISGGETINKFTEYFSLRYLTQSSITSCKLNARKDPEEYAIWFFDPPKNSRAILVIV